MALPKGLLHIFSVQFKEPYKYFCISFRLFWESKLFVTENTCAERIKKEIRKVGHHALGAFPLDHFHNLIVRSRMEFHQNLAYNTDTGLFHRHQRQIVEVTHDSPNQLVV